MKKCQDPKHKSISCSCKTKHCAGCKHPMTGLDKVMDDLLTEATKSGKPKQKEVRAPERGTLDEGEKHPGTEFALAWWNRQRPQDRAMLTEAFASVALEGNFSAEICSETIRRLNEGEMVSDRYFMGMVFCSMYVLGKI